MTSAPPAPRTHHAPSGVLREPMSSIRRSPELNLDGVWQFQLLPSPAVAPAADAWAEVEVPSLWTMDERFGHPQYTNIEMPFGGVYPLIPEDNPVGVYRTRFTLPKVGDDERVILHVGAAEGHLTAQVNGTVVGVSTDSHLHAEFDITNAVNPGDNDLELHVARWSAETFIEDQDQWWHSGLSRSVSLHTTSRARLIDVLVHADFDPASARGSLRVDAFTDGLNGEHSGDYRIRATILGAEHDTPVGGEPASQVMAPAPSDRSQRLPRMLPDDIPDVLSIMSAGGELPPDMAAFVAQFAAAGAAPAPLPGIAQVRLSDLAVEAWSAERPHLEDLRVELLDPAGAVIDAVEYRVGFRRVEIVGPDLLVNGRRILIQGVNRHDVDPRTGRVMSRERMRAELSLLKRFNFNAIRTSHYPNDPYLLDLCDEYGLYVVDEADVEGHAYTSTIADDPRYLTPIVERIQRMVLRDRNHPSVIIWSLGNETGYGAAHDAAAGWLRRADPTRPLQYEGAIAADWHGGRSASDIVCPMYPSFPGLEAYARDGRADRPLISCEYAFSLGNSSGGLAHYWHLFETSPALQGGFIWQFLDHALDPEGDGRFRYGGDFGDTPNDGAFLLCGIAFADLTPKPALYEARGLFSPVRIESDAAEALAGRVRIRSRRHFADVSDLSFTIRVETRSGAGDDMAVHLDLAPGAEQAVTLPPEIVGALHAADALALTLVVTLRRDSAWAPAGTELSAHQVQLAPTALPLTSRPAAAAVTSTQPAALTPDGALSHPLLQSPPQLCLWRAQTDNDASVGLDGRFEKSGLFRLDVERTHIREESGATLVERTLRGAFGDAITHRTRIRVLGTHDYLLDEYVRLPDGPVDVLRVGVQFSLAAGIDHVDWTGLGPWENYPDRRASAMLGRWSATIDELATPYVRPQDNGTRGGVDELALRGVAGRVDITAGQPLWMTASRHSTDALERTAHWWELPPSDLTHITLDVAHRGVGTGALGPDTLPQHRITESEHEWQWRLRLQTS